MFKRATRTQARLRMALIGPSGSGKTYSALTFAEALGGPIAVLDTEHGSAAKYAGEFEFDTLNLENFDPRNYIKAIQAAASEGYNVLIIDSLSHAWVGTGGALELKDRAAAKRHGNTFAAWADVTPLQNQLYDTIIRCGCHVIATMRAKTEYVLQPNAQGKSEPRRVGMGAVQREGAEYEFDIVAQMDIDHRLIVDKTRFRAIDGAVILQPDRSFGAKIAGWLSEGEPAREPEPATTGPASAPVAMTTTNPDDPAFAAKVAEANAPVIDRDGPPIDYAAMAEANDTAAADEPDDSGDNIGGPLLADLLAVRDAVVRSGKMTAGQWAKAIAKRGVPHEAALNKGQAREIIARVRPMLDTFGFEPDADGTAVDPTIPQSGTNGTNGPVSPVGPVGTATQGGGDAVLSPAGDRLPGGPAEPVSATGGPSPPLGGRSDVPFNPSPAYRRDLDIDGDCCKAMSTAILLGFTWGEWMLMLGQFRGCVQPQQLNPDEAAELLRELREEYAAKVKADMTAESEDAAVADLPMPDAVRPETAPKPPRKSAPRAAKTAAAK